MQIVKSGDLVMIDELYYRHEADNESMIVSASKCRDSNRHTCDEPRCIRSSISCLRACSFCRDDNFSFSNSARRLDSRFLSLSYPVSFVAWRKIG